MIDGQGWALLSVAHAVESGSSTLARQKLARAGRSSEAHGFSTGFGSSQYGGSNAIWMSPSVESRDSRTGLPRCTFRPSRMIGNGWFRCARSVPRRSIGPARTSRRTASSSRLATVCHTQGLPGIGTTPDGFHVCHEPRNDR